jgi:hypothetical protein
MADDLETYIAEQMRDPEFASEYERQGRIHERFMRRWRLACGLGWHRRVLSDGSSYHCACGRSSDG